MIAAGTNPASNKVKRALRRMFLGGAVSVCVCVCVCSWLNYN